MALAIACAILVVLLLAMDVSLLNVFDLAKASYSHGLAWLLLGVMAMIAAADGVRIPRSPLFVAFFVLIGVELLTTATATNQYVAVFGEVGRYLGLTTHLVLALVAIALAVGLDYPRRTSWLAAALAGASVVALAYAALQAAGDDPIKWTDRDSRLRPFGTLGNPDFYGQFLAAAIVAAIAVAVFGGPGRLRLRAGAAVLALLSFVMLLITTTRGGLLGVVGGALILGLLWLRRAGLARTALARAAIGTLVFAAGLVVIIFTTQIGDRLVSATNIENVQDRVLIYTAATQIFLDHPILGMGFENFAVAYPRYAAAEGINKNRTQTSAHNWLLHVAATTGIVGLAATGGLIATFAIHVWKRARDEDALALLAAAGALAAFYGSGLVLPGAQSIQWVPWCCFGVALASDIRTAPTLFRLPPMRLAFLARVVIIVGLAFLAFMQSPTLDANRAAKTAESQLRSETAQASVAAAKAATSADPGRAVYWNDLGRALELVDDQAGARRAYLEATARSPYTPAFWWNLGRMDVGFAQRGESGAKAAAYDAFQRALAASPRNPDTYDQFARAQLALGDYADAVASEQRAIGLFPNDVRFYPVAAEASQKLGDDARSLDFLRQGVAATDANEIRLVLARRLVDARADAEARRVLDDVLRTDPTNKEAQDLLDLIGG